MITNEKDRTSVFTECDPYHFYLTNKKVLNLTILCTFLYGASIICTDGAVFIREDREFGLFIPAFFKAFKKYSADCAPEIPNLRLITKKGTPLTPTAVLHARLHELQQYRLSLLIHQVLLAYRVRFLLLTQPIPRDHQDTWNL